MSKSQIVVISQEDIKDYLYRLGVSPELSQYFGLPPAKWADLHAAFLRADVLPPQYLLEQPLEASIVGTLRVLPMGLSWAFWLSQQVHTHLALIPIPGMTPDSFLVDRRPSPALLHFDDCVTMIYADNSNHLGLDVARVIERRNALSEALNKRR